AAELRLLGEFPRGGRQRLLARVDQAGRYLPAVAADGAPELPHAQHLAPARDEHRHRIGVLHHLPEPVQDGERDYLAAEYLLPHATESIRRSVVRAGGARGSACGRPGVSVARTPDAGAKGFARPTPPATRTAEPTGTWAE